MDVLRLHDCDRHHLNIPDPEILVPDVVRRTRALARDAPDRYVFIPHSYDAIELGRTIDAIVEFRRTPTSKQSELIYEFNSDYLSTPSIENISLQELHDFYNSLMEQIDNYFFQGALMQGPTPHLRLVMIDEPHLNIQGFWGPVRHIASRLRLVARNSSTGKRRSKLDLLTTLVHELAHAYIGVFFNFCPDLRQAPLVLLNDGHGETWRQIYNGIVIHMRTWHPSLLGLGVRVDDFAGGTFVTRY
ncbi:hypothetical protein F4803DRAFT_543343 [Xylaria telfairii]|nr:hypothetical protein F4803DRAFT_543343 [Xylaria telfairii]